MLKFQVHYTIIIMENLNSKFVQTINALETLENILRCGSCNQLMKIPVTLWSCDHVFCKSCIANHTTCPTCGMPAWAQDQTESRRLESISFLCSQMRQHINDCVEAKKNQETSVPSNLNKKRKPKSLKKGSLVNGKKSTLPLKSKQQFSIGLKQCTEDVTLATPQKEKQVKRLCTTPYQTCNRTISFTKECNLTPKLIGKNAKGESPLHVAAIQGNTEQVQMLLKHNVHDVNIKDNAGWTPLHEACNRGHVEIVEKLLDAGAFIDIPGYENETPLIDAVVNGRTNVVKVLLTRSANADLRNSDGKTAIELAETAEMKQLLEQHMSKCLTESKPEEEILHLQQSNITIAHSKAVLTNQIKPLCEILNARSVTGHANSSTHFIVSSDESSKMKRTLKYLQAMAVGSWIVHDSWMKKCLEHKNWISEFGFMVNGSFEDDIMGGPLRSIMARLKFFPRLFNNCHFFMYGSFSFPSPSKQQLIELLKASGGQILRREPKPDSDIVQTCTKVPYYAKANTPQYYYTYYIVYDPSQPILPRLVRQGKVCTVPVSWILDCISQFIICDID